ncbi:GNAT family N-acetyltransferase [Pseudochelatococcus sp. B33]
MSESVANNTTDRRFELTVDDHVAFINYRIESAGDGGAAVYVFEHTVVPPELGGRGVGTRLASGALDAVREAGAHIRSECSFISSFLKKHHDQYEDILAK